MMDQDRVRLYTQIVASLAFGSDVLSCTEKANDDRLDEEDCKKWLVLAQSSAATVADAARMVYLAACENAPV